MGQNLTSNTKKEELKQKNRSSTQYLDKILTNKSNENPYENLLSTKTIMEKRLTNSNNFCVNKKNTNPLENHYESYFRSTSSKSIYTLDALISPRGAFDPSKIKNSKLQQHPPSKTKNLTNENFSYQNLTLFDQVNKDNILYDIKKATKFTNKLLQIVINDKISINMNLSSNLLTHEEDIPNQPRSKPNK